MMYLNKEVVTICTNDKKLVIRVNTIKNKLLLYIQNTSTIIVLIKRAIKKLSIWIIVKYIEDSKLQR